MRPLTMWPVLLIVMSGCENNTSPGAPSGDTVMVSCYAERQPTYQFGCGVVDKATGDCGPSGITCPDTTTGTIVGSISMCKNVSPGDLDKGSSFGAEMDALCARDCDIEVAAQAEQLDRCIQDIEGCDDLTANWILQDCTEETQYVQELQLTYEPVVGEPMVVAGSVSYTLEESGGTIWSMSIDAPLTLVGGLTDATVLLGYPEGTEIEVSSVSLAAPLHLELDSDDAMTVREPVTVVAEVTLIEPNGEPRSLALQAAVPFTLDLVVTKEGLTIDSATEPLGGTVRFDGASTLSSLPTKVK